MHRIELLWIFTPLVAFALIFILYRKFMQIWNGLNWLPLHVRFRHKIQDWKIFHCSGTSAKGNFLPVTFTQSLIITTLSLYNHYFGLHGNVGIGGGHSDVLVDPWSFVFADLPILCQHRLALRLQTKVLLCGKVYWLACRRSMVHLGVCTCFIACSYRQWVLHHD